MEVTALAAACGAGVGLGVFLVVLGLRGDEVPAGVTRRLTAERVERSLLRVAIAIGAGAVVGAVTRWPVAALSAVVFALALPNLVGGRTAGRAAIARTEAIAAWTEMLRDTMAGAAGLEGAIAASAQSAPAPIRRQVASLAARLERQRLGPALRAFADELSDPTADLVVAALVLASDRHAGRLGDLLGSLARSARDHATMRLRVEAGRARTRTAVRVMVGATLVMAVGLVLLNRGYLAPYDSALGQLVLLLVVGCFTGSFWWLARMARAEAPARFLAVTSEEVRP